MENQIFENVKLGRNVTIHAPCIIGLAPRGRRTGELPTAIGDGAEIRPFSTIYAGVKIGRNFKSGQGVSIREDNVIGDDVSVGTNAVLEFGNRIGNDVRIHTGCFLEDVVIGDHVFVGPNVVFTDDPHPMKCPHYLECAGGAKVEDFAKIGANSTILPAVKIGRHAFVGAGTVVVKDVSDRAVVVGNPGRSISTIDQLTCPPGFFDRPYQWEPYTQETESVERDADL